MEDETLFATERQLSLDLKSGKIVKSLQLNRASYFSRHLE